jgi:hypothetical protein
MPKPKNSINSSIKNDSEMHSQVLELREAVNKLQSVVQGQREHILTLQKEREFNGNKSVKNGITENHTFIEKALEFTHAASNINKR